MERLKAILYRYRDVVPYLFFGVCTTVVNVIAYWISAHLLSLNVMASTIIAWILAVLFAYYTNRKWVFKSKAITKKDIAKEIISFFGCRIATGIIDWLCMFIFVELIKFNDVVIKVFANVIVIILNYASSKLIIFKGTNDK